jgi:hypothetical protein
VTTVSDLPIKIVTEPVTVTLPQFDSRGRVTGNTQVTLDAPPLTVDDPLQLVVTDEPLVANIAIDLPIVELPDFSSDDAAILETQGEATAQDQANFKRDSTDWRVRLALAPGANYLYAADDPGILAPLSQKTGTSGVIFPYTPIINVTYAANYTPQDIIHSNYKVYQYQNSSVDSVSITGTFTCQDVFEANYLLAVIHFFRSMTKMF